MNVQKHEILTLLQQISQKNTSQCKKPRSLKAIQWAKQTGLTTALIDFSPISNLNPKLVHQLKAEELTTKFWFQTQYQATLELVTELNKLKITPTLLKGLSISSELYPKPYYRNMRDIDILVEEHELNQVEQLMLTLGYEQKSQLSNIFYKTHHHTKPWQHKTNGIWFEIHTGLIPISSPYYSAHVFSLATINNEKSQNLLEGKSIYRLSHELQVVYIATHWGEAFKQIGGLFAFIDIAFILNKKQLNWEKLIHWANEPYVANYVYISLSYLLKNNLLKDLSIQPQLKKIHHTLSFIDKFLLHLLIDNYLVIGKPFSRLLTTNNVSILWALLLSPIRSYKKLILIPVYIAFPPQSNKKFNLTFQLSRIKRLLFKSS